MKEILFATGNKSKAKETMKKAGVPVVPGSDGLVNSLEDAKKISKKIPRISDSNAGYWL